MRFHQSFSILLTSLVLAAGAAAPEPKKIDGWGKAIDPTGDCQFDVKDGKLHVTVPGAEKPHDLSPELESSTAPRVLQPVTGDFLVQVKVGGEFEPGDKSTQATRTSYTGAGLVIFADDKNFIRLERAALQREGQEPFAYLNFELREDGRLVPWGSKVLTEKNQPIWFRLERRGNEIHGATSPDGEHWDAIEPARKIAAKAWGESKITAGVAAISTSTKPFAPVYSDLAVKQRADEGSVKLEANRAPGKPSM